MESNDNSSFRILEWDSAHFGLRIGRVLPAKADAQLFKDASTWADQRALDCMYLLLDSRDTLAIRLAGDNGWRIVDVRVTLGLELTRPIESHSSIRRANAQDLPYLTQLAKDSHKDSRFYSDGNFAPAACDELFSIWIAKSVQDPDFAGAVFVAERKGAKPAGYITCAAARGTGTIGLIAVDPAARGEGLGRNLLAAAAFWFSEQGAKRATVVTQGCNIAALRMYERYGFRTESVQFWFHWWRT